MTEIFQRLLKKRGVDESFLQPEYRPDFYADLPDILPAVKRIKQAIKAGEKILIYGDYDADGVTASTVMLDGLKLAGVEQVEMMLPDRFKDGYGMGPRVVERASQGDIKLIVTVDCGSNNAEIIDQLNELGVDTIVTDHHEISGELPKAVAVINPKRGEDAELRELAGVGVAFMVVCALAKEGLVPSGQEKWLLDLVLIGTLCDSMVLTGLNRELCFYGMKVLKKTRRVGLIELMKVAGMKEITAESVGFLIGPRLNAAGRMDSPEIAFKLLNTESKAEALRLAERLNELNTERKQAQSAAVKEITTQGIDKEPVIVVQGKWHEGVLGIVAGRLMEDYKKPALVLTEVEDGVLKGSGRSFGEFNLAEALSECQKWLVTGGGHMSACGLKVLMVNFDDFKTGINEYYKSLKLVDQEKFLQPEIDLKIKNLGDLKVELGDELKQLEPYGPGNPEPVFGLEDVEVLEAQTMGEDGKHLRLLVRGAQGGTMKVVAFYAPKQWTGVQVGQKVNLAVTLTINEWNGRRNLEGRMISLEI